MMFSTNAMAAGLLIWLTWHGEQSGQLHLLIAQGCFWLLAGTIFVYVGAATAQDVISLVKAVRGVPDK